jgi:hypothetical protein
MKKFKWSPIGARMKIFKRKEKNNFGLKPESIFETFFIFRLPLIRHALFVLRLICWILYDIAVAIKNRKKKIHLYGIWCFVGLPGAGKTMSLVRYSRMN